METKHGLLFYITDVVISRVFVYGLSGYSFIKELFIYHNENLLTNMIDRFMYVFKLRNNLDTSEHITVYGYAVVDIIAIVVYVAILLLVLVVLSKDLMSISRYIKIKFFSFKNKKE